MSAEHPIVAITGAMESGSVSVITALERIFYRERVKASYIDGSAFRRYDRTTMREAVREAKAQGKTLGHFGLEGNHLEKLESLFLNTPQRAVACIGTTCILPRKPANLGKKLARLRRGNAWTLTAIYCCIAACMVLRWQMILIYPNTPTCRLALRRMRIWSGWLKSSMKSTTVAYRWKMQKKAC